MSAPDLLTVTLAAYREVLGKPEATAEDDFFALGGDSMQAMDVIALVEDQTGAQIPVGLFFGCPTAAELAAAVAAGATA